ncbi:recombinase [Candidatus Gracilibacteria bacterium]|nr:recombinase [Candidatus Gracilibacteria bacterium]
MEKNIYKELSRIQKELKVPKTQRNSFGNYNFRSCEDILEGVKPLLNECILTITDDVVCINNRVYIKSIAKISLSKDEYIENVAFAREDDNKKGMDLSQLTGSTSSYARKYALNGLFAIDDTKDSDFTNKHDDKEVLTTPKQETKNNEVVAEKNIENVVKKCEEKIGKTTGTKYYQVMAGGEVFNVFNKKLNVGDKIKCRLIRNGNYWDCRDLEVENLNIKQDELDEIIPF